LLNIFHRCFSGLLAYLTLINWSTAFRFHWSCDFYGHKQPRWYARSIQRPQLGLPWARNFSLRFAPYSLEGPSNDCSQDNFCLLVGVLGMYWAFETFFQGSVTFYSTRRFFSRFEPDRRSKISPIRIRLRDRRCGIDVRLTYPNSDGHRRRDFRSPTISNYFDIVGDDLPSAENEVPFQLKFWPSLALLMDQGRCRKHQSCDFEETATPASRWFVLRGVRKN